MYLLKVRLQERKAMNFKVSVILQKLHEQRWGGLEQPVPRERESRAAL